VERGAWDGGAGRAWVHRTMRGNSLNILFSVRMGRLTLDYSVIEASRRRLKRAFVFSEPNEEGVEA
jgi:hypothetical protein